MTTMTKSFYGHLKGRVVSFIIEKAPSGSLMRSGTMHAGTVVLVRGERVTIQDANGYRYTVQASGVRS